MVNFRKQEDCPASQKLLAYQLGDLEQAESRTIGRHLAACEFCTSEVTFYEHYPPAAEADEMPIAGNSIPEPLLELAEALLSRERGSSSIDEIMKDIEFAVRETR